MRNSKIIRIIISCIVIFILLSLAYQIVSGLVRIVVAGIALLIVVYVIMSMRAPSNPR